MAIPIFSSWLVSDFYPVLGAWYATCREAVTPVRRQLKQERDEKDKVMRWALWCLRVEARALIEPMIERGLFSETTSSYQPLWLILAHMTQREIDERIDGSLEDKYRLALNLRDMLVRWGAVPRDGNSIPMSLLCWAFWTNFMDRCEMMRVPIDIEARTSEEQSNATGSGQ